jgi:cytochrome c-type biogenesis protein CcmH
MSARACALAAVLALALAALPAVAAHAAPRPGVSFNSIEAQVMCDTCNVPLNVADSPRADQERREIHRLIDQGLTTRQILDRLKSEYGPDVLGLPQGHGFSLAAYLVPIAVVAALLALLLAVLPRWRRRPRAEAPAAAEAALTVADSRRLEEDLARYDV